MDYALVEFDCDQLFGVVRTDAIANFNLLNAPKIEDSVIVEWARFNGKKKKQYAAKLLFYGGKTVKYTRQRPV